jgi:hypothetical protein
MRVTASKLRTDIYNILDEALKTGVPVEVVDDPDDIVHMDWLSEWSEMQNLQPLPDGRGSE